MKREKLTIGRIDKIDLPDIDIVGLEAKVDTGAYTSALHCHHIQTLARDGVEGISFKLLDPSHPEYNDHEYFFENFSRKKIKSSSGHAEWRYIVKTSVVLFGRKFKTEFSLADREQMKFPVLLGRKFLRGRFVVDVSEENLSYHKKTLSS